MPFGKYSSFSDCVATHSDKKDPHAYCAAIMKSAEGEVKPQEKAVSNELKNK